MKRKPFWLQMLSKKGGDESSMWHKIGWSQFAMDRHVKGSGNSYFDHTWDRPIMLVQDAWSKRYPGQGETCLTRKIVVPVDPAGFYTSLAPLTLDMPVKASVTVRQEGEDPYVETYITTADADRLGIRPYKAEYVNIVLYSRETLLENGGTVSCPEDPADWEIVAILASRFEIEPMPPLTMARNFLEKPGGTKSVYTALEFAEAIYFNSQKGIKIKDAP